MITVKATREGLPGQKTASGYVIEDKVPFVALPSTQALHQWVLLYNPENGNRCRALVLDVGPWNTDDHAYVFQERTVRDYAFIESPGLLVGVRPKAETGLSMSGKGTNGSGIDLGEAVWRLLEMKDNSLICWEFA